MIAFWRTSAVAAVMVLAACATGPTPEEDFNLALSAHDAAQALRLLDRAIAARPRPEYLGMIRIVEANHQKAIGRLMRGRRTGQSDLRPGDEVASQIR